MSRGVMFSSIVAIPRCHYLISSLRHSVDSVASYSSQNHVDHIRTKSQLIYSKSPEEQETKKKHSKFRQQRSVSNLELTYKRPESAVSNSSSTKKCLRGLRSQDDGRYKSTNKSIDLEYLDNPAENVEFNRSHKNEEALKKRKLTRTNKEENLYQNPSDHKAKHISKIKREEYYANVAKLPQDEFYQHLTRSRASREEVNEALRRAPDAEFHGVNGKRCKHKEVEGTNLRRSRSLAVIREETFNELQVQPHAKSKRSQLIPRARLFDKPGFKDRAPSRPKCNGKEEPSDKTYSKATGVSIEDAVHNPETKPAQPSATTDDNSEDNIEDDKACFPRLNRNSKSVGGSWPNISENNQSKHYPLSEDSINLSHNPSEIDSLDSNYVRKHYNFEAHRYKESSSEATDLEARSPSEKLGHSSTKQLFIFADDTDANHKTKSEINLPSYFEEKYDTDRTTSNESESEPRSDYSQNCANDPNDDKNTYEIVNVKNNCDNKIIINTQTITRGTTAQINYNHIPAGDDCVTTSPPDSLTSYSPSPPSTEKSRKLENLANSLAEKIDEYCDSKFNEKFIEIPLTTNTNTIDNNDNSFNSKTYEDIHCIYTQVKKVPIITVTSESPKERYQKNPNQTENQLYKQYSKLKNNNFIADDLKTRSLYRHCGSTKNITTEAFVTTLIENQYYSLPDINVSKSLRRSERIDAKLRQEDRDDESYIRAFNRIYNRFTNKDQKKKITNETVTNNQVVINTDEENNSTEQLYDSVEKIIIDTEINETKVPENFNASIEALQHLNDKDQANQKDEYDLAPTQLLSIYNGKKESSPIYQEVQECNITIQDEPKIAKVEKKPAKIETKTAKVETKITKVETRSTKVNNIVSKVKRSHSYERAQTNTINPIDKEKVRTRVTKHYSLRQRDPKSSDRYIIPPPDIKENNNVIVNKINIIKNQSVKNNNNTNVIEVLVNNTNVAILPLSGHQTLIIDPPVDNKPTKAEVTKKEKHRNRYENSVAPLATKLKKDTSPKIAAVQNKFERPPPRLIIKDSKSLPVINLKKPTNMSRPQVLNIVDNKSQNKHLVKSVIEEHQIDSYERKTECRIAEKLNNAVKTDIEYQEKLHSVKNYWSKLIDKTNDEPESVEKEKSHSLAINDKSNSVDDIIKTMEAVKIVDSIKKPATQDMKNINQTEEIKEESDVEETTLMKIVKDTGELIEKACITIKQKIIPDAKEKEASPVVEPQPKIRQMRDSPEIEIVALTTDDGTNNKEVKHATLIKSRSYSQDSGDFDHVRYKVMKSDLFRKSMIGHYKREAQFDGLLQYLQDYSFQELLVNNNIVIIEPVRTSVDSTKGLNTSFKRPSSCRIAASPKKNDGDQGEIKKKSAIRRHFFYHPIRVNKEIIEEELPNPDTVKKVRNLFEDTLKLRRPDNTSDPGLVEDISNLSRRSLSYRNLTDDSKINKNAPKKNVMRYLTIDTSYGNKKWDNASMSSGVSSGDLSSNNEHDFEGDALSPFSHKVNRDNVYSSSSEEYLYESLNNNLCYESQYVSQDILKKIRDCGTSITYYGGKVLDHKYAPAVSPMTKAIMDEIRGLQKCNKKNCTEKQCLCVHEQIKQIETEKEPVIKKSNVITIVPPPQHRKIEMLSRSCDEKSSDNYSGFKFKLVKSNSCSSRLELAGADPRLKYRNKDKAQSDLAINGSNSVKTKIFRIESYKKGTVNTPFENKNNTLNKSKDVAEKAIPKNDQPKIFINGERVKVSRNRNVDLAFKDDDAAKVNGHVATIPINVETENSADDKKKLICAEPLKFEKKHYYVNDDGVSVNGSTQGKFGEMIFEEFEVLESCYDSLNSVKSGVN